MPTDPDVEEARLVAGTWRKVLSRAHYKEAFSPYWQDIDMQRHAIDKAHEAAAAAAIRALDQHRAQRGKGD